MNLADDEQLSEVTDDDETTLRVKTLFNVRVLNSRRRQLIVSLFIKH